MTTTEKVRDKDQPFRVIHPNGDIMKGYSDLQSAREDTEERNARGRASGFGDIYAVLGHS